MRSANSNSNSLGLGSGIRPPLNEDAARESVPNSSSSQRGAEECTNKSIRNDNGGGEVNADDNASEAVASEISGDSQGCQLPQGDQGSQVPEEKRRKTITPTIVTVETGSDLRWIYCRERGCTFWTRKPGTIYSHL